MIDIPDLIFKQYQSCPDEVAVIDKDQEITYRQLLEKAFQVSNCIAQEAKDATWIGIATNEGWLSYGLILGCWLSGKGYIPVNEKFPIDDNKKKLSSAQCDVVLSFLGLEVFSSVSPEPYSTHAKIRVQGDFAYLLHTSGTTGEPKGVPISWDNLTSFYHHYDAHPQIEFTCKDRFLQSYELTFDVSVFCFLSAFVNGGTLVLPEETTVKYQGFFKAIKKHQISVVSFVPSVLRLSYQFLDRVEFPSIKYSFFSGEALYGNWAKAWMNCAVNAQVYNCYGPTETVIVCTEEHLNKLHQSYFEKKDPLPLGSCFEGVGMQIIDGEIIFSGDQVFNGYLNSLPIDSYPTGDLGELDQNGKLIFKGRKDEQVQWNGYRIELLAIDNHLSSKLKVAVKSIYDQQNHELVIFTTGDTVEIWRILKADFPTYFQPSKVMSLPEFPQNKNGKLDRSALLKLLLM